jgi:calcineurin-like phosphoesterase
LPTRFEAAKGLPKLHGVVITVDTTTGQASAIERLSLTRSALEDM